MALYTGWGKGKKEDQPFSKSEFEKSYIKKHIGSYKKYLTKYSSLPLHKHKKKRIVVKKVVKQRQSFGMFGRSPFRF